MTTPGPLLVPVGTDYELQAPWLDVPAGFRSNGASIPRLLWPVLGSPFEPALMPAAVRHDYAYRFGVPDRRQSDRQFRDMLRGRGVGAARTWLLWAGVRLFGWLYWRRCRYGRGVAG